MMEPDLLAKFPASDDVSGPEHWRSAVDFFMRYGSHLVTNYTAGDALYQVLVYNASSVSNHVEFRGRLEKFRPMNASRTDWMELLSHPTPVHVGKLQVIIFKSSSSPHLSFA